MTETGEKPCNADSSASVEAEAARWDARLRAHDCSSEERARFQDWLKRSSENAQRFASLQQSIEVLQAASLTHPGLRAMRERAQAARRGERRTRLSVRAVAAAILALVGVALAVQWHDPVVQERSASSVFQTAIGERSTVQLQDGSEISLDTRSRVEVTYSSVRRAVEVAEGRAYFRVAKDPARSFSVNVAGREIVAIGTEFDVRLDEDYLFVTLIEGRVDVLTLAQSGDASTARSLTPGQRLIIERASGALTIEQADIEKIISWKEGKILFEDAPLDEVVAEMNRYSAERIVVDDAKLAQLHVNGMFYTEHPSHFLQALAQYLPIRLRVGADGTTYISEVRVRG